MPLSGVPWCHLVSVRKFHINQFIITLRNTVNAIYEMNVDKYRSLSRFNILFYGFIFLLDRLVSYDLFFSLLSQTIHFFLLLDCMTGVSNVRPKCKICELDSEKLKHNLKSRLL